MSKNYKLITDEGKELDITSINIDPNATQLIVVNIEGLNRDTQTVNTYLDNLYRCVTALGVKNFAIMPCVGHTGEIHVVKLDK